MSTQLVKDTHPGPISLADDSNLSSKHLHTLNLSLEGEGRELDHVVGLDGSGEARSGQDGALTLDGEAVVYGEVEGCGTAGVTVTVFDVIAVSVWRSNFSLQEGQ